MKIKNILCGLFAASLPFLVISCDSDSDSENDIFGESQDSGAFDENGVATDLLVGDVLKIQGNDSDDLVVFEVLSNSRVVERLGDQLGEERSYNYEYVDGVGILEFLSDSLTYSEIESLVNTALADPSSALSLAVLGGIDNQILSELIDLGIEEADLDADGELALLNNFTIRIFSKDNVVGELTGPIIRIESNTLVITNEETGYAGPIDFVVER